MFENMELRRQLDMIDSQICSLLAKREQIAGEQPAPDRRRLAAVRKISQRFGRGVGGAYGAMLKSISQGAEGGRVIDISRELLSTPPYPGDPEPKLERVMNISDGDVCNLSRLEMSAHNATHIDAPLHYIDGAGDVAGIDESLFYGGCIVINNENITPHYLPRDCERVLVKGGAELTDEQAEILRELGVKLIGVETQSVGGESVHKLLLGAGIVLLEGLELSAVEEGEFTLICAPLKIAGAEGAPCRALLVTEE